MIEHAHEGFFRPNSAFNDYLQTVDGVTEAPLRFHIATALTVVGSIIGRRAYFPWGKHKVYPINPAILVGPSGIGKGEALGIGKAVLRAARRVFDEKGNPSLDMWLMEDEATPQALARALQLNPLDREALGSSDVPEVAIIAGEMATFLNKSAERDNMVPVLTKLLEQDDSYTRDLVKDMTKKEGRINVNQPTVNFIAGTTIEWMRKLMPNEMFSGGFFRRCILIVEHQKGASIPWPRTLDNNEIEDLAERIKDRMRLYPDSIPRVFDFSPSEKWWRAFKTRHDRTAVDDPRLVGHYHSMPQHIQKTALAFACARGDRKVTPQDCRDAEVWISSLMPDVSGILLQVQAFGFQERVNLLERVLMEQRKIHYSELWKRIPCPAKEFNDLVNWARGVGMITESNGTFTYTGKKRKSWGRPT